MGQITVLLATGDKRVYDDTEEQAVGVAFGRDERRGWLQVLRHDLKAKTWSTWAYFPAGGWVGMEGSAIPIEEVPRSIGFQGRIVPSNE
jgi:hypothetical protein